MVSAPLAHVQVVDGVDCELASTTVEPNDSASPLPPLESEAACNVSVVEAQLATVPTFLPLVTS